jgi:hypothetical protein
MTEAEWLNLVDVNAILDFHHKTKVSDRKFRLFACACGRDVWDLPFNERQSWQPMLANYPEEQSKKRFRGPEERVERNRRAIKTAERFADGHATTEELSISFRACEVGTIGRSSTKKSAWSAAGETAALCRQTLRHSGRFDHVRAESPAEPYELVEHMLNLVQRPFLQDIFGNPFRPVTIDPKWLNSIAVDLAAAIYNERAFDRMPILADALMDAGCDNEEVIGHCRSKRTHVRGCWVVDLLLDKE